MNEETKDVVVGITLVVGIGFTAYGIYFIYRFLQIPSMHNYHMFG